MAIVKIMVDGCECEYITSLEEDFVEENDYINNNVDNIDDDTIEIRNLFNNEFIIDESSEING